MSVLRQAFVLLVAAVLLNPVCCCAMGVRGETKAAPVATGCCGGASEPDPSAPADNGCPNQCGCDQNWRVAETTGEVTLIAPPPGSDTGPLVALTGLSFVRALPTDIRPAAPSQAPPAWQPVPAFLRSHAFRC
jgi:hypothetical protein